MMMQDEMLDTIRRAPILPTVLPINPECLSAFADILHEEGYPALEVLARPLELALENMPGAIAGSRRNGFRWGIGTMRTRRDAERAVSVTPDFLVSPAFSRRVLEVAMEAGIPYIPGVRTLQDVQNVVDAFDEHGQEPRLLKLCPVMGLSSRDLQVLCGCYPGITFCPTGEVTLENYLEWIGIPGIAAPMGSGFVPREWLEAGRFEAVRERLRLLRRLHAETCGTVCG